MSGIFHFLVKQGSCGHIKCEKRTGAEMSEVKWATGVLREQTQIFSLNSNHLGK